MAARCIGVISDTHGLLRDEVRQRLEGCDLILHAGDVGGPEILDDLRQVAEVVAVRGNMDRGAWAESLNEWEYAEACGRGLYILHQLGALSIDPVSAGIDVVVYGHSHKPDIRYRKNVLYLNPGSAGPRRFDLPVSMALLTIDGAAVSPEVVLLQE